MPSYTKEQREAALREPGECGGSVIQAIRRLGHPSKQRFEKITRIKTNLPGVLSDSTPGNVE